jgi:hypothetical protein
MTAMFPSSGVPANEAKNTLPSPWTVNCNQLWYSTTRCLPRFDPVAANAMLSELINAINCAGIPYDCTRLDNLCLAIQTMIQDGGSNCLYLHDGPFDYAGGLNPRLLAYPPDCCMFLKVIPNIRNQGSVRINIDGLGYIPVLRNDGTNLLAGDFLAGVPFLVTYCNGALFIPGLVSSQVPIVKTGGIDCWIRTDGNDTTGDGTANTPGKAFRTIAGCWYAVGSRYAATPLFSINMRLGIPGDYEGAWVGNFGGGTSLTGDPNNHLAYRILSRQDPEHVYALCVGNMGSISINGVNLVMRHTSQNIHGNWPLRCGNSSTSLYGNVQMTLEANSPSASFWLNEAGCYFGYGNDCNVIFEANNLHVNNGIIQNLASSSYGCSPPGGKANLHWRNANFKSCCMNLYDAAVYRAGWQNWFQSNCHGPKYSVSTNAILEMGGQQIAGDQPGYVGSQGQVWA